MHTTYRKHERRNMQSFAAALPSSPGPRTQSRALKPRGDLLAWWLASCESNSVRPKWNWTTESVLRTLYYYLLRIVVVLDRSVLRAKMERSSQESDDVSSRHSNCSAEHIQLAWDDGFGATSRPQSSTLLHALCSPALAWLVLGRIPFGRTVMDAWPGCYVDAYEYACLGVHEHECAYVTRRPRQMAWPRRLAAAQTWA
ncbi:hypothetical protein RJ55_08485 [Drechmeria coniospora]|nr:hypothetical protein RJ55_08485 [Drechmeria coniospora]